jgi:ParB family chromosome partitioning protein
MKPLGLQPIPISSIDAGLRLRPVDEAQAAFLAENIQANGLRQPVEVRAVKGGGYRLIAGGHRLAACARLGWTDIPAFVFEATDDEARLAEIDENLVRHELNPLDRATFLFERKELYEKLHPQTKHGAQGGPGGKRNETEIVSFSKDTAERVGLTDRSIRLSVKIATSLAPDVKAQIAGTRVAKVQAELLALAKLAPTAQRAVLALLLGDDPKAMTVRQAVALQSNRPATTAKDGYARLMGAWARATIAERDAFTEWLARTTQTPETEGAA